LNWEILKGKIMTEQKLGLEDKFLKSTGGWDSGGDYGDILFYGETIEGSMKLNLTDYAKNILEPYMTDSPFTVMLFECGGKKITFIREDDTEVSFNIELNVI
jgi:hypothetical protein